jgi:hypothetical protein
MGQSLLDNEWVAVRLVAGTGSMFVTTTAEQDRQFTG